ncbi:(2Fe-2S)-binding protein [Streptomyces sp. PLK6-54]|uniref:(2Fe-2S)-binding protein n=2 Tax=Actinacidiphila acidipaludis TaxID=2873382 RepID=A0ABS7Q812_9ACTN|nr:(2Fe-2S)-binding protein [Streptomyces acidipaludis]
MHVSFAAQLPPDPRPGEDPLSAHGPAGADAGGGTDAATTWSIPVIRDEAEGESGEYSVGAFTSSWDQAPSPAAPTTQSFPAGMFGQGAAAAQAARAEAERAPRPGADYTTPAGHGTGQWAMPYGGAQPGEASPWQSHAPAADAAWAPADNGEREDDGAAAYGHPRDETGGGTHPAEAAYAPGFHGPGRGDGGYGTGPAGGGGYGGGPAALGGGPVHPGAGYGPEAGAPAADGHTYAARDAAAHGGDGFGDAGDGGFGGDGSGDAAGDDGFGAGGFGSADPGSAAHTGGASEADGPGAPGAADVPAAEEPPQTTESGSQRDHLTGDAPAGHDEDAAEAAAAGHPGPAEPGDPDVLGDDVLAEPGTPGDPAAAPDADPSGDGDAPPGAAAAADVGAGTDAEPEAAVAVEPEPEPEPEPETRSEHPLASYTLRVNGTDRPVTDAWLGESLLYVLRERLGLAGAKDGCEQGECGACSVQVDGRLVASCLVPAATAAGSEVRTVEGLTVEGRPSDVQQALADCGAVQCGFCIPGMAMTVHDLLEGNHRPTDLEVRQALSGNLCRCSGYRGVREAVRQVVAGRAAEDDTAAAEDAARVPHQGGPAGPEGAR